jgi:hypothetical protein
MQVRVPMHFPDQLSVPSVKGLDNVHTVESSSSFLSRSGEMGGQTEVDIL